MANRLIDEQSPYLLQHAHNPVDWYPWGAEAFDKAKEEHKPVLVSIGYAACHWCHVMERESFENEAVAEYMNTHFVNIKVDREEYPDVDHMYMDAVQAITGSGGWPLNVFVTPDRVPFYGGTYFPPQSMYGRLSWVEVLQRMNEIWHKQQDEVSAQADQMVNFLKQASAISATAPDQKLNEDVISNAIKALLQNADKEEGGFGRAPKFLGTMAIAALLNQYYYRGDEDALRHARLSLDKMLDGGIYDQVGGGISRYATDDNWLIPHFEKMLYDNALLVSVLSDAFMVTKEARYEQAIRHILSFVNEELKNEEGGFYCALDADSEGVEGKFYTWDWDDWIRIVGDDEIVTEYFGVEPQGNWEETNILHIPQAVSVIAERYGVSETEVLERVGQAISKLKKERAIRVRPQLDDKSLLSWNALMNIALSKAGVALGDKAYIEQAVAHASWLLKSYTAVEGKLLHTWKKGVAKIHAKLDDHAYLVKALIELGSATGDSEWVLEANKRMVVLQKEFAHENNGFFYFSSTNDNEIPVRKVDIYDGAQPSANAVLADCLIRLGICMEQSAWIEQGRYMLHKMLGSSEKYPYSFAQWITAMQCYLAGYKTVVVVGEDDSILGQLHHVYAPSVVKLKVNNDGQGTVRAAVHKVSDGQTLVYVCDEEACMPPANNFETARELMLKLK